MSLINKEFSTEVWKEIPSTEGRYQISDHGRVRGFGGKILNPPLDSHGYRQVGLYISKKRTAILVHRLVAENFLPPPSKELIDECLKGGHKKVLVNHKDENPLNNHVDNLEWCTPAYNNDYSPQDYSGIAGDNCKHAVLTEAIVDEILRLKGVESQQALADRFGVKQVTISNIYTGRSWSLYTGITRTPRRKGKRAAKTKVLADEERCPSGHPY